MYPKILAFSPVLAPEWRAGSGMWQADVSTLCFISNKYWLGADTEPNTTLDTERESKVMNYMFLNLKAFPLRTSWRKKWSIHEVK